MKSKPLRSSEWGWTRMLMKMQISTWTGVEEWGRGVENQKGSKGIRWRGVYPPEMTRKKP